MLLFSEVSVLMGSSHQTQGGKFGANPALSRNCKEIAEFFASTLSQNARRSLLKLTSICEVQIMSKSFFRFQLGSGVSAWSHK